MQLKKIHFQSFLSYFFLQTIESAGPLYKWIFSIRNKAKAHPSSWNKVLIASGPATHIGDVLYRTAPLSELKRALPNTDFFFEGSFPAKSLLKHEASIKSVLDLGGMSFSRKIFELSKHDFDAVLATQVRGGSRDLLFAELAKIPSKVGYPQKGFSFLITHPVPFNFPSPFAAYFRDMVAQISGVPTHSSLPPPVLRTSLEDKKIADIEWRRLGLDKALSRVVAFFPFTRQVAGLWPLDFTATLAAGLIGLGFKIVLGAGPNEKTLADTLDSKLGTALPRVNIPDNLRALAEFIGMADALVSADSGPRHLAAAMGIPRFFPSNPASNVNPVETGPYLLGDFDFFQGFDLSKRKFACLTAGACAEFVGKKMSRRGTLTSL